MSKKMITSRYELLEKLGQGGMGAVHKVKDRLLDDTVALKQVLLEPIDLDFASRADTDTNLHIALTHEFKTLAGLRHPNIISVLDYGYDNHQQPFYTMEYIENSINILEVGQSQNLKDKVYLLIELLQGLAYLHRHQIIHRDLKPENIMVVNNQVKVLDFGLAIFQQEENFPQTKGFAGTLSYVAPELLRGRSASITSDLYAVGVIAFEMFAGQHPFYNQDLNLFLNALMNNPADVKSIELPLKLTTIVERLLEKTADVRYRDALEVIHLLYAAINESVPPERIEIRESYLQAAKFVGRETELKQLENAQEQTQSGKVNTWLIGGESGVGKSRLVEELQTRAMVKGMIILRGQAVSEGGLPFQLWRDVVKRLILIISPDKSSASILKDIVPDIEQLLEQAIENAPELTGIAYQQRLILTIVNLLKQVDKPLLLILEDLQWTRESLSILQQVIKVRDQLSHLMIVGTYRNDEHPDLPEKLDAFEVMLLYRLNSSAVAELSRAMLGEIGKQTEIVNLLEQETEGNTFFMVEVVRALAKEAGRLNEINPMNLPEQVFTGGMQHILQRRLTKVPKKHQSLLQFAAVAGRQLDLNILQHRVEYSLDDWLAICADYAVLELNDQHWRFSHDKLREAILQEITDDQQSILHRDVAQIIESIYPDDENYNAILLEHWHRAGDVDKEIQYLNPVSEHLLEIVADYAHAKMLLERGSQQLSANDPRQVSLWNKLASSYYLLGSSYDKAQQLAQQANNLARKIGDESGNATSLFHLGYVEGVWGNYEKTVHYYKQSLEIRQLIDDQIGTAYCLINIGFAVMHRGEFEQATHYFEQGLEISQTINDQMGIATSLSRLGVVASFQGKLEQATHYYQRSLEISQTIGAPLIIASNLNNLGMIFHHQSQYEQATDYFQQSLDIRYTIGDQSGIAMGLNNLGFVYLKLSKKRKSQKLFRDALTLSQSINLTPLTLEILLGCAILYLQSDQLARAGELIGLVRHHPSHDSDIQERLDEFLPLLEEVVEQEKLEIALQTGKELDLDIEVQKVLKDFTEKLFIND